MSVQVIKAGIMDTLQDGGRFGHRHWGINPSGAMDGFAMQVANALVGNSLQEAVIELYFPASAFLFSHPALIALAGADFSAAINGEPVPVNQPIRVNRHDVLQFRQPLQGAVAYLAVAGGFQVEPWMGSYSTHLRAQRGGFGGRMLRKGDEIRFRQSFPPVHSAQGFQVLPWKAGTNWGDPMEDIGILPGQEWNRLTVAQQSGLPGSAFHIQPGSDRMGFHLRETLQGYVPGEEMLSVAVTTGTIQLLPEGHLVILMADHQVTGGYPRVAHVISAHLSKLSQHRPGEAIRFRLTDQRTAETLFLRQRLHLLQLQNACTFRLEQYFHAS